MKVQRAEIWLVNLEPTIGAEIRKKRPVVVVNSDAVGTLPIRLVAPVTEWKDHFTGNLWHVKLLPDRVNGLAKTSAVDALQLRGVDVSRFDRKLGQVTPAAMRSIVEAVAIVIEMGVSPDLPKEETDSMVTILPSGAVTEREWNFRDDINQEFMGDIPENQEIISLTLNWKPDKATAAKLVGKYRIDLGLMLAARFVRKDNRGIFLRFQRTDGIIEIAVNRGSPALVVGRRPQ